MIEISIPLFECFVRIYGQHIDKYEELIRKASWDSGYKINKNSDGCTCPRWVFDDNKLCYIMWIENSNKIDVFMHELYHLVCTIQNELWIDEETCAYLIWYIIREYQKSFSL